ncbi:MAG: metal-dependent phosphohydrolase, partial [Planctomycetota bacterium]
FRAVYFHRTVRAIDKTLRDVFVDSRELLFPHDPRERLDDYCGFTEWSLLIDVSRWRSSDDPAKRALAPRWERILGREVDWVAVEDRSVTYGPGEPEQTSLFSDAALLEQAIRARLPAGVGDLPMQIDLPRHIYRPDALAPTSGQNFQFKPSTGKVYPLTDDQLFAQLPLAHRACRIYLQKHHPAEHAAAVGEALDALLGSRSEDDLTNM